MKNKSCYVELIVDVPELSEESVKIIRDSQVLVLGVDHPKLAAASSVATTRMVLASFDVTRILLLISLIGGIIMSTRFRGMLDTSWWTDVHQVDHFNKQLLDQFIAEVINLTSKTKRRNTKGGSSDD